MPDKIMIEALVDKPRDHVWHCYVTPAHITEWNFADPSWCCPSASVDLRVGGRYVARMEARDQSFGFDFGGTYHQIEQHGLLEFHLDDGRVVEVVFDDHGTGTKVTTRFDPETQNPVEMQRAGWQAILNNFKTYAEGQRPPHPLA